MCYKLLQFWDKTTNYLHIHLSIYQLTLYFMFSTQKLIRAIREISIIKNTWTQCRHKKWVNDEIKVFKGYGKKYELLASKYNSLVLLVRQYPQFTIWLYCFRKTLFLQVLRFLHKALQIIPMRNSLHLRKRSQHYDPSKFNCFHTYCIKHLNVMYMIICAACYKTGFGISKSKSSSTLRFYNPVLKTQYILPYKYM